MEIIYSTSASIATGIIGGIISVLMLTVVIAICGACPKKADTKKNGKNGNDGEPTLQEVTPSSSKKASTLLNNTISVNDDEVKYENESIIRHSNGSVVKENRVSLERPTSHDQRALPAIPHAGSGQGLTSEDEEDIDEGHYDVITNRRRKTSTPQTTSNTASPSRQNLYEKVDDIDGTYAGIKSDTSDPGYAGVGPAVTSTAAAAKPSHPYAVVNGIGVPDYAHIEDKKSPSNPRLSVVMSLGVAPQASVETLDSYSSGPPIPDKNFVVSDSEIELATSPIGSTSPYLPPRNADRNSNPIDAPSSMIGGSDTSSSNQMSASVASVSASPPSSVVSMNSPPIIQSDTGSDSTDGIQPPKKKGPDYSSVTARESLANMRERQAAEMRAKRPMDVMYETVNYEAVKVTAKVGASDNDRSGQRNSLTSDLYAEIASASGDNSARSSMYARVGDVNAPTPPPVDLLKNLGSAPSPDENDAPDPGYSMIKRRPRPQTGISSEAVTPQDEAGAIYAVIDKTRKNRATIHISHNVENDMERQMNANRVNSNLSPTDQIYHANRSGTSQENGHVIYDNSNNFAGARPKIRSISRSPEDHAYSNNRDVMQNFRGEKGHNPDIDPYARIKETDPYSKIKGSDSFSKERDPNDPYSRIKDVDPNDPYSRIKERDPNDPYARIKEVGERSYSKAKDNDSAGYSRIKDVNNIVQSDSFTDAVGYARIKDLAEAGYASIPADKLAPPARANNVLDCDPNDLDSDPNYDHIGPDNVTTVKVSPGYATEISLADVANANADVAASHAGSAHRREHLYEEIGESQRQRERLQGQLASGPAPTLHKVHNYKVSTDL